MNRRCFLATTGLGISPVLGGCLNDDGIGAEEQTETKIIGVSADAVPNLAAEPSVSVVNDEETDSKPAKLSVDWVNTSDEPVLLGEARSIIFTNRRSETANAQLIATDHFGDLGDTITFDGCWRVTGGIVMDGSYNRARLKPDETHRGDSALYARGDDCFSDGTYRFTTDVTVVDPGSESDPETSDWGVSIDVQTEKDV